MTRDDATLAKLEYVDFVVIFALRAMPEYIILVFYTFFGNDFDIALNAFDHFLRFR